MPDAGIEFCGITLQLLTGHRILDDISLCLHQGTTTALLGRSGSGKTTLLRLVNRLIEPTSGKILIEGKPVTSIDPIQLRRRVGYVIQETGLFPHFTIERNAAAALEIAGNGKEERMARAHELLATVGLDGERFARRYPHELSGGQRQRVGLARALAADPSLLLLDEPFGALDPLTRAEMQQMLSDLLLRIKKTVLIVTHDLDEALLLAQRIVLMDAGRVVADLTPEEMLRSREPAVLEYVEAFQRSHKI
jgi:osmoprotectant transport system ATP-binding protein